MFPNPSKGLVSLRNLPFGKLALRLMNVEGQTLYQLESTDHERLTLDLSALKSGIYFIEVQGEGMHWGTKKLVIQR